MQDRLLCFVGTWQTFGGKGDGIHVYDVDAETGALRETAHARTEENTSMLCVSPDARRVFAVDERKDYGGVYGMGGGVVSFAFAPETGELRRLNAQPSLGSCPAYVALAPSGRLVAVANHGTFPCAATTVVDCGNGEYAVRPVYDDASTVLFPVRADGSLGPACSVAVHRSREGAQAHCHSVQFTADGRRLIACDKGLGRIYVYAVDADTGALRNAACSPSPARPGSSPRHQALHPNGRLLLVSNEYEYSLSCFALDATSGEARELDARSTDFDELAPGRHIRPGVTDVLVHPNGRFVYVANRTTNNGITGYSAGPVPADYPNGTLSIFDLDADTGALRLRERFPLACGNPRTMAFSPDGEWLYVAELDRDCLRRYRVDPQTGLLSGGEGTAVPSPSCVRFVQLAREG